MESPTKTVPFRVTPKNSSSSVSWAEGEWELSIWLASRGRVGSDGFSLGYAIIGAQRATRLIGLFVRLARRDRKPGYLTHLPRVAEYLERNLLHPELSRYQQWLRDNFGTEMKNELLSIGPAS